MNILISKFLISIPFLVNVGGLVFHKCWDPVLMKWIYVTATILLPGVK